MREWFENKTISVVGNAASLLNHSFGCEIDRADVVVRINRGGYRFPEYPAQMGTRLDVWCMQNVKQNKAQFQKSHTRYCKKIQMDTIDISPQHANIADYIFTNDERSDLEKNLTKKASTGLRVLYLINKMNPSHVNVYGFDWKQTYSWHERRRCVAHVFSEEKQYCIDNFFSAENFSIRGYDFG